MREVVLGTAGHVDHGKTSLVKALTGIDTDRLKEEKNRGITIVLGFAYLDLPCGHRMGIVDVPGHERFVKNMVAGATGIDLVAFIVAADEGIMPQTREHFEICKLLGIKRGLVVITKKDMVEPDWLDLVTEEVGEFFSESFLADAPILTVSSTTGEGIAEVRAVLDTLVKESDFSEAFGPFRLPVDRVFSMKGFGVVVTGTAISGRIRVGDDVTFYPRMVTGKIRGIQVHGQDLEEGEAGHRTAINIQGLDLDEVKRGDMLANSGCLQPAYMLDADFMYLAGNKKPLKNRTRVRVHLGTAEIMGRIVLLEDEELAPGTETNIQLLLENPVGVWPGDRYVVRSYSPIFTIGGGVIHNGSPSKRRRFKEINKEIFDTYHNGTPEDKILLNLRERGLDGLTLDEIGIRAGLFGKRLEKILKPLVSSQKILVIDSDQKRMMEPSIYNEICTKVNEILSAFHEQNPLKQGIPKEELRSRLYKGLDPKLFQYLQKDLIKRNIIVRDEATIRLASHRVAMKDDVKTLKHEMLNLYRGAVLSPPTVKEVFTRFDRHPQKLLREVLDLLVRDEELVKVNEDLFFHTGALDTLQSDLVSFLQKEKEIDAPRFKQLTGLTRKFFIPLLEYFDKEKVTIRLGDKRILRDHRS